LKEVATTLLSNETKKAKLREAGRFRFGGHRKKRKRR